ncbi:MAG: 2-oxo acid dehydrogenase subunit E2 [Candidatus Thermoplasmatota archaeon]|nr:2-oxo acid dehydrogenase subunit E2 [Candidatus Thermoplasmatota archaeon]MCL5987589.1 2-oxo acid dehydrogenase subunit E2 [Candidatus Thermoplasmatota archaeon]
MFKFKLPDIGEGVTEGEIIKWLLEEGQTVKKEQDMVEIMTDKVNISIPSPVEGKVVKLVYPAGKVVKVGDVIIEIDDGKSHDDEPAVVSPKKETHDVKGDKESLSAKKTSEKEHEEVKEMDEKAGERKALATPTIRRLARERGIDIDTVKPTGPNGRITIEDLERTEREKKEPKVEAAPATEQKVEAAPPAEEPQPEKTAEETPAAAQPPAQEAVPVKAPEANGTDQIFEPKGLRRIIFDKMSKSKQIMPHFMVAETVNLEQITKSLNDFKEKGTKVTMTAFFVKAVAVSLLEFPKLNAHYDEANKRYIFRKNINIGVAIDTPDGLTVAVVKDAVNKSVMQISDEIADLAKKARENKLTLQEVQDSTFTLSNVGTIGGIISTPIINYPEVAIMAVHRPFDGVNTYISLSCDHRLIDGADAARFITKVREFLHNPITFLIR